MTTCTAPANTAHEDPRKTGLKNGLRQLTRNQLKRVLMYAVYGGELVLDTYSYHDGHFCPLAIGLEFDRHPPTSWGPDGPTHEKVFTELTSLGYKVYNTRGVTGEFYQHPNRERDLIEAACEVLEERSHRE